MPSTCSAYGCTNRSSTDGKIHFYSFPLKNEEILRLWLNALARVDFKPTKTSKLCSDHFTEEDYMVRPGTSISRLKLTAVPSIFVVPSTYKSRGRKVLKSPDRVEAPCPLSKKKYFKESTPNVQNPPVDLSTTREVPTSKVQTPLYYLEERSTNIQPSVIDLEEDPLSKKRCLEVLSSDAQTQTNDPPATREKFIQTIGTDKETILKLRQRVQILQQKLRRRDTSICKMKELLRDLARRGILESEAESSMSCYFEDL